jgi:hypothetical protein
LPCVFLPGTRQGALFAVRFSPRRTTKGVTRRLAPAPSVVFFCPALWKNARQRLSTVRCQTWRTAKGFTVQNATVRPLPWAPTKNARQRVCRAFYGLCRALVAHGKAAVSRYERHYSAIVSIELVDGVASLNCLQELNFWPLWILKSEALWSDQLIL